MGPYEDQKARIQDQVFPIFKNKDTSVAKTPPKQSFGSKLWDVVRGKTSFIDKAIYKKELKKGIIPKKAKLDPK
tara:strand:- start:73 stop:294 length:222 start_codon:yes stop_codon:yes gene_type:complete